MDQSTVWPVHITWLVNYIRIIIFTILLHYCPLNAPTNVPTRMQASKEDSINLLDDVKPRTCDSGIPVLQSSAGMSKISINFSVEGGTKINVGIQHDLQE